MKRDWQFDQEETLSTEGYWASYSDLMAGVLLVFAVAAASAWIEFHQRLVEPTEPLTRWQQFLDNICDDERLLSDPAIKVDCDTGSLIIRDSSLSYELNDTQLNEIGKEVLLRIVPAYLEIVERHLTTEARIEGIEIGGHTDSTGTYEVNATISSERARNVLLFLLQAEAMKPFHDLLYSKGYSVGYADSRPPIEEAPPPPGERLWPAARRIEIQVHIDTATILQDIKRLLDGMALRGTQ